MIYFNGKWREKYLDIQHNMRVNIKRKFYIALTDKFNQVSLHNPSEEIINIYKGVPEINELDNRGFPICRPLFSHSSLPYVLGLLVQRTEI